MPPRKASAPDTARTVIEGRDSEHPVGRLASTNNRVCSNQPLVIVVDPVGHRGRFRGRLDGRVLVASSRTPFCDAARVLLAEGVASATRIVMRHAGSTTDAVTATLSAAAKLTVEYGDHSPRFRKWRPLLKAPPRWEGAPRIAPNDAAATNLPGGTVVAQACKTTGELGSTALQRQHGALPADSPRRKPPMPRLASTGRGKASAS
jgi:hypothetical protein